MSRTYEMLWDCPACGTKKLLGKTHRFCPNCGSPQDAKLRYFPSDSEKVAVEGHVFVGADRVCPACSAAMSAKATHCGACGSPLDGAVAVQGRADQRGKDFAGETVADAKGELEARRSGAAAEAAAHAKDGKRPGSWRRDLAKVALFIGAVGGFLVCITYAKPVQVRVAGHSWKHEITIETLGPVKDSAWCDSLPTDAFAVSRTREVRSHRQIPDGQSCHTVRHDNEDGTFTESEECETKYRSEPVYDERCHYTVNRWHYARSAVAQGKDPSEPRSWPVVSLAKAGDCLGCEREGPRVAEYLVRLEQDEPEGDEAPFAKDCAFDASRWAAMALGSTWTVDVGVFTGGVDCDTLRAP